MTANAVDVIGRDHRELDDLFHELEAPHADRGTVLKKTTERLAAHISVERSVLGPAIKHHDIGDERFQESLTEELKKMEHLLVLIERRKVNSPDMPELATDLLDTWQSHARQISDIVVPELRKCLGSEDLDRLGEEMSAAEEVIVSHPHPHLLSLGPLSRFTTRLAARFDRMRDRTVTNR